MFLFSLLSSSAPSPFDRMSMRLNRSPNQSWLPEGGLVWRHLTATKSRDAAAPPGCERHQLHLNSRIANCICLIVQNVFVFNCQMYLSGKKPRCCPAASATSFTLSTNLHLVHPLKKGFPDKQLFPEEQKGWETILKIIVWTQDSKMLWPAFKLSANHCC